jgi:hypothetical protein
VAGDRIRQELSETDTAISTDAMLSSVPSSREQRGGQKCVHVAIIWTTRGACMLLTIIVNYNSAIMESHWESDRGLEKYRDGSGPYVFPLCRTRGRICAR